MTEDVDIPSHALYYDFNHAVERILKREPSEITRMTSIPYDEKKSCFTVISLAQSITVTYPDCKVTFTETGKIPILNWRMPILHHLATADGVPPGGNLVPFRHIDKPIAHPINFENDTEVKLLKYFDNKPADKLRQACEALGGEVLKGNADLFVRFDFLPKFAIYLKFWYSGDDPPGSVKFLFDDRCIHYLEQMDVQVCGPILADFIVKQYELTN